MTKEIIYVGDPMCSWCYGFSPVIQSLYARHGEAVTMSLVVGGLHVGDNCVNDDRRAAFLREHWNEIEALTGQPFKLDILDRRGWVYDTEPACRAVVAMRRISSGSEFPYFAAVQAGFYAENRDSDSADTYAGAAGGFGVDRDEFLAAYEDPAVKEETIGDFRWAQTICVTGLPAVLVKEEQRYAALTLRYQPLEALAEPLERWLRS